jgi:hypothetical protein
MYPIHQTKGTKRPNNKSNYKINTVEPVIVFYHLEIGYSCGCEYICFIVVMRSVDVFAAVVIWAVG